MPEINISNSAGRDAVVTLENVTQPLKVRWLDDKGRPDLDEILVFMEKNLCKRKSKAMLKETIAILRN